MLFADVADANRFQRRLLLWLDGFAAADQPAYPANLILALLLTHHGPQITRQDGLRCPACQVGYPCAEVMAAVATSGFPHGWTGRQLSAHLAQIDARYDWSEETLTLLELGDPTVTFVGRPDGRWDTWIDERGATHSRRDGLDDPAMVDAVLERYRRGGYPYMFAVDEEDVRWVRLRLADARGGWSRTRIGASHQDRRVRWRGIPSADPLAYLGWGSLQYAIIDDDPAAARVAIAAGRDPEAFDEEGRRPLHLCAEFCSVQVARYLLEEVGVEVGLSTSRGGLTPLYLAVFAAARNPEGDEVVRLLVRHGADPDQANGSTETARALAGRLASTGYRDIRSALAVRPTP